MNIDELTFGQIKEIQKLFGNEKGKNNDENEDVFVGKYVLCRCYSAGVHTGFLVSQHNDVVILKDSRRLWSWKANGGIALSGVAQTGMAPGQKVDVINPMIRLTGVIETIICSNIARDSIHEYK